ncbi:hypothetical protein [Paraburkholderia caffeinilytica]|uniref:hypothetical protein n=1 Tax=Paraburkholderia caffeinilytica TaxID=1761016 RepID=UPI0038BDD899
MKNILTAFAVCLVTLALGACTVAQQQTIDAVAANAKTQVSQACTIVQPVLLNLSASMPGDANLALLTADNGKLCAAVVALDATSVQNLINTVIPQAIGLVALLPIDAATGNTVRIALGAASLALSNWLLVYGAPAVAPTPASAPIGASA